MFDPSHGILNQRQFASFAKKLSPPMGCRRVEMAGVAPVLPPVLGMRLTNKSMLLDTNRQAQRD
jgi:hypothetical protein